MQIVCNLAGKAEGESMNVDVATHLCFCGSGKAVATCCYATANTLPPGNRTGYSHPKCYAKAFGDCSFKVSKEHFVSESVLKLLPLKDMTLTGAPFLQGGSMRASPAAMSSKVLCERHNNALSSLDSRARQFFGVALAGSEQEFGVICGTDLERWMLKFMCGLIASGQALARDGTQIEARAPNARFLNVLFGTEPLGDNLGLHVFAQAGRTYTTNKLQFCVFAVDGGIKGCAFTIDHVELLLMLEPLPQLTDASIKVINRPAVIVVEVEGKHREIHLGWPGRPVFHLKLDAQR